MSLGMQTIGIEFKYRLDDPPQEFPICYVALDTSHAVVVQTFLGDNGREPSLEGWTPEDVQRVLQQILISPFMWNWEVHRDAPLRGFNIYGCLGLMRRVPNAWKVLVPGLEDSHAQT